jgi:hypothetical protein
MNNPIHYNSGHTQPMPSAPPALSTPSALPAQQQYIAPIYQGQYYMPSCIPPYLANYYMKVFGGHNNINYDLYYPPYIPCL